MCQSCMFPAPCCCNGVLRLEAKPVCSTFRTWRSPIMAQTDARDSSGRKKSTALSLCGVGARFRLLLCCSALSLCLTPVLNSACSLCCAVVMACCDLKPSLFAALFALCVHRSWGKPMQGKVQEERRALLSPSFSMTL